MNSDGISCSTLQSMHSSHESITDHTQVNKAFLSSVYRILLFRRSSIYQWRGIYRKVYQLAT